MPTPKNRPKPPIGQNDIEEYSRQYSDFGFERQVLHDLTKMGLECKHSGTYRDAITDKIREFDLRGHLRDESTDSTRDYLFSIECKNIRETYPLVAHCVKRVESEAYHDIIRNKTNSSPGPTTVHRVLAPKSKYSIGGWVAKSIDQVGRDGNGAIKANDSDVFDKTSQAINSSVELIKQAHLHPGKKAFAVIPVLVVPDGRLWQLQYAADGSVTEKPCLINRVEYFVGHTWQVPLIPESTIARYEIRFNISHLEIVTQSSLSDFVDGCKTMVP